VSRYKCGTRQCAKRGATGRQGGRSLHGERSWIPPIPAPKAYLVPPARAPKVYLPVAGPEVCLAPPARAPTVYLPPPVAGPEVCSAPGTESLLAAACCGTASWLGVACSGTGSLLGPACSGTACLALLWLDTLLVQAGKPLQNKQDPKRDSGIVWRECVKHI